jgi:hypothetical protein
MEMKTEEFDQGAGPRHLRVGEVVEVRSEAEILATLDANGELDSLPFMPEMLRFCGRRFRVDKLALKSCDTVNWSGMYRMRDAVHLENTRCDGQAHGGCQAGCLLFWKEAWLKRVESPEPESGPAATPPGPAPEWARPVAEPAGDRARLLAATTKGGEAPEGEETWACQATELPRAAPDFVPSWDLRQYVADVRSGNATASRALRTVVIGAFNELQDLSRRLLPRWLRISGGRRFPVIEGRLRRTPLERLDLRPGERVRVKSREEIVRTLDRDNRNRGMTFDPEMLRYCGRQATVLERAERIIDEKTGKMTRLRNPCIVLDGVVCTADYHRLCPRGIYPYWREIWLERVP